MNHIRAVWVGAMLTLGCSSLVSEVGTSDGGAFPVTDASRVDDAASQGTGSDAGARCSLVTDTGAPPTRVGCVYPDTCDYATLRTRFRDHADILPAIAAVSSNELWVTGDDGYLLHGVMDARPRMELIPLPTSQTMGVLWASGPDDVWVAANSPEVPPGSMVETRALVYHWDGCHWTRHDGPAGFHLGTMAGSEPGRPWMGSGNSLLQWSGSEWVPRDSRVLHGNVGSVYAMPGGSLFGAVVDYRQQSVVIYRWADGHWVQFSDQVLSLTGLTMAFGRDWAAISVQHRSPDSTRLDLYPVDGEPERMPGNRYALLGSAGNRLASYSPLHTSFYSPGQWRPDALGAALRARETPILQPAVVYSHDSDPLGLDGVRWYFPLRSAGGGVVGCSMREGQVHCIGALEGRYDLNQYP